MSLADAIAAVRANGKQRNLRCPAHKDGNASLSVGLGDDGRVLLHCHTGCAVENVVAAVGLTMADLFPKGEREDVLLFQQQRNSAKPLGCTLAAYSAAKQLPIDLLRV